MQRQLAASHTLLQMMPFRVIFQPKAKKTVKILSYLALLGHQVHKKFWWKNMKEKRSPVRPKRRWKNTLTLPLKKHNVSVQTGFIWLRIGTSGWIWSTQ
jgi:hypothetical protein